MVSKLKTPRRVMLLVKAGSAVDSFINQLVPLLDAGDIIIDGGNSEYQVNKKVRLGLFLSKCFYRCFVPLLDAGDIIIDGGNSEYQVS